MESSGTQSPIACHQILLADLSVHDIEQYEEPDDADTSEPTAPECARVYSIARRRRGT